MTMMGICRFKK